MTFHIGPFRLDRVNATKTLNVSLTAFQDTPFGWEYGWSDPMRGVDRPLLSVRVGKLNVFYFEKHKKGFELWIMGFWWIK